MMDRKSKSFKPKGRKSSYSLSDMKEINYKNVDLLKQFTTERGKILPRRITGVTAKQQRFITKAIKHARCIALMPFVSKD